MTTVYEPFSAIDDHRLHVISSLCGDDDDGNEDKAAAETGDYATTHEHRDSDVRQPSAVLYFY